MSFIRSYEVKINLLKEYCVIYHGKNESGISTKIRYISASRSFDDVELSYS